ncbi:MAG: response regulator [Elusimicrobiota bacterium]
MGSTPSPQTKARAAVLIVDDDPDDLFALRATLESLELDIVQASDGEEALRRLLERDFAVIVMDLMMPRLNGFEAAALIRRRERSRDLPILILTGFDMDGMRGLPGYGAEGLEFMSKPVLPQTLRAKVAECAARAPRRASG